MIERSKSARQRIRNVLYYVLFSSGVLASIPKALAKLREDHRCIILVYHRIVDDATVYLNKGPVVHHRIRDFEKEIPYLKKHFCVIAMDDVVDHIVSGKAFTRPSVALTFDDGYLDNYTLAYPVLKKYGVPATIYLATSLIGSNERTWTDQIEYALLTTGRKSLSLSSVNEGKTLRIGTMEEKRNACIRIGEALKCMSDASRKAMLEELFINTAIDWNGSDNRCRVMLNWDEVREMAENGITFGSHSHTHPILSRLPLEKAKQDILMSKSTIEDHLGTEAKHFAFPNGRAEDFSDELERYCLQIGFKSVSSVTYGSNGAGDSSVSSLRRIGARSPVWLLAGELMRQFMKISAKN